MDQFIVQLIALALFTIGLYGIMTSKLGLKMLISVEIVLNSAILSLVSDSIGAGPAHVSPLVMALCPMTETSPRAPIMYPIWLMVEYARILFRSLTTIPIVPAQLFLP